MISRDPTTLTGYPGIRRFSIRFLLSKWVGIWPYEAEINRDAGDIWDEEKKSLKIPSIPRFLAIPVKF
jgi:hypothetical protein